MHELLQVPQQRVSTVGKADENLSRKSDFTRKQEKKKMHGEEERFVKNEAERVTAEAFCLESHVTCCFPASENVELMRGTAARLLWITRRAGKHRQRLTYTYFCVKVRVHLTTGGRVIAAGRGMQLMKEEKRVRHEVNSKSKIHAHNAGSSDMQERAMNIRTTRRV